MSVGRNTADLWKRSPPWRILVLSAALITVVSMFAGGKGSTPTPPPSPPNLTQNSQGQACGPQGQTTVQAPIVVSSTGQMPSNVQATGQSLPSQGGIPPTVLARFTKFVTQVDAANLEQRLGERCVRMNGALDAMQSSDYAYADCFQDGQKKLVAAQSCAGDFQTSEVRFGRLDQAFQASQSDGSAAKVEELARARERMLPFDETRERWGLSDAAVAAGDDARVQIAASDQRIAALKALATATDNTPATLQRLAGVAKLTALDRSRLSDQDSEVLARAEGADQELKASDRRLAAVGEALELNSIDDGESRSRLISALSALTDLDTARANPAQTALLERARTSAAEFALSDLVSAVAVLDMSAATPEDLQQIRDLAKAARVYGTIENVGPDAAQALATANLAANRLTQSDQRIRDVYDKVRRIEDGGPSSLDDEVLRTHDAITDFDKARMSDSDRGVLIRLTEAKEILNASRTGALTRDVPIFLRAEADDQLSVLALSEFRRALQDQGFNLVDALERAAVDIRLNLGAVQEKSVVLTGSNRINTAEVNLNLLAQWIVAGEPIVVPRVEGSAAGNDLLSLRREAVSKAALAAAKEIGKLAKP